MNTLQKGLHAHPAYGDKGVVREVPAPAHHLLNAPGVDNVLEDVRTRLIDAAQVELAVHGRVSVRVSRIARKAHVTTGAIYSNFGSRDELLAQASAKSMRERTASAFSFSRIAPLLFQDGPPDFQALYEALGLVCSPQGELHRLTSLEAMLAGNYSPAVREHLYPIVSESLHILAGMVQASQRAGYTRSDLRPLAIATNWLAAAMGSVGVEYSLRDRHDNGVGEAARQSLFAVLTAFCVEPPEAPWGREVARMKVPPVVAPPDGTEYSPSAVALLESAKRWLWEAGNVDFSVQRVAADAGLTTGALYSQFRSREGMIAAAYLSRLNASLDSGQGPLAVANEVFIDAPQDPDRLMSVLVAFNDDDVRYRRASILDAMVESMHNDELRPAMCGSTSYLVSLMAPTVEAAQARGYVRADLDPLAIAAVWIGCSLGLTSFAGVFSNGDDHEVVTDMVNAFLVVLNATRTQAWSRQYSGAELAELLA